MVAESSYQEQYCLQLANGQNWKIIATEGARTWVRKLATIMELKRSERNGYSKLIFVQKEKKSESWDELIFSLGQNITENFPQSGWRSKNFIWLQIWSNLVVPDIVCEMRPQDGVGQDILKMRLSLQPVYRRAQDLGGLSLHAGLIEKDGMGVLVIGPRNSGKSTCCFRIPRPWHALCDEETLIVRDSQGQYLAHPFPTWSEYLMERSQQTWNVHRHLPLSAIFFLEQAKSDEVTPVGQGEATALINHSAIQVNSRYWRTLDEEEARALKLTVIENACKLARSIPAFRLQVSLKGQFWNKMEANLP